jgi:hypothetical protein
MGHPHLIMLIVGLAGSLTACNAVRSDAKPDAQTVQLSGTNYLVEELTASTWTALAPRSVPDGPQRTAGLVKAIEKASGCKVTDSSYGARSGALTAQVDCGGKLKN